MANISYVIMSTHIITEKYSELFSYPLSLVSISFSTVTSVKDIGGAPRLGK